MQNQIFQAQTGHPAYGFIAIAGIAVVTVLVLWAVYRLISGGKKTKSAQADAQKREYRDKIAAMHRVAHTGTAEEILALDKELQLLFERAQKSDISLVDVLDEKQRKSLDYVQGRVKAEQARKPRMSGTPSIPAPMVYTPARLAPAPEADAETQAAIGTTVGIGEDETMSFSDIANRTDTVIEQRPAMLVAECEVEEVCIDDDDVITAVFDRKSIDQVLDDTIDRIDALAHDQTDTTVDSILPGNEPLTLDLEGFDAQPTPKSGEVLYLHHGQDVERANLSTIPPAMPVAHEAEEH